MVRKIFSGIEAVLIILLSAIALHQFVPDNWVLLNFYLNFSEGIISEVSLMHFEICLLFAAFAGQIIIGLSQLYGLFKPNPLSRFARIAIDLLLLVFAALNFEFLVYYVDEENLLEFIFFYILPTVIAAVDAVVMLVCSIKEKEKLFSAVNGVRFMRGLQLILIPAIIFFTAATMHEMMTTNIKRDAGNAALNVGFDSFTMLDMDGNEYTEDMFSGHKITMVNFWATFCHPCIGEMPELQEITEMYDPADFQLIGITSDVIMSGELNQQKFELARTIVDATGVKYPILTPAPEFQCGVIDVAIFSFPQTIFFNENGEQVFTVSGPRDKDEWIEIIEEVLANES